MPDSAPMIRAVALTWAAALLAMGGMRLLRARGAGTDADAALAAATERRTAALALLLDWGIDPDKAESSRMILLSIAPLRGHAETPGLPLDSRPPARSPSSPTSIRP